MKPQCEYSPLGACRFSGILVRTSNALLFHVMDHISKKTGQKRERETCCEDHRRILNPGYQTNWAPRRKKGPFLALNCACQEQSSPAVCCTWSSVILWYYTAHLFKNYKLLPFVYLSVRIYSSTYVFKCIFKPFLSSLCPQHELACWVRSCMHV